MTTSPSDSTKPEPLGVRELSAKRVNEHPGALSAPALTQASPIKHPGALHTYKGLLVLPVLEWYILNGYTQLSAHSNHSSAQFNTIINSNYIVSSKNTDDSFIDNPKLSLL